MNSDRQSDYRKQYEHIGRVGGHERHKGQTMEAFQYESGNTGQAETIKHVRREKSPQEKHHSYVRNSQVNPNPPPFIHVN